MQELQLNVCNRFGSWSWSSVSIAIILGEVAKQISAVIQWPSRSHGSVS